MFENSVRLFLISSIVGNVFSEDVGRAITMVCLSPQTTCIMLYLNSIQYSWKAYQLSRWMAQESSLLWKLHLPSNGVTLHSRGDYLALQNSLFQLCKARIKSKMQRRLFFSCTSTQFVFNLNSCLAQVKPWILWMGRWVKLPHEC